MTPVTVVLPTEVVDEIVKRVTEHVLEALAAQHAEPLPTYLTVGEAAEYLRCSRQRIYDLRSSGQLSRLGDGRRALVSRVELDAIVGAHVAHALPTANRSRLRRAVAP